MSAAIDIHLDCDPGHDDVLALAVAHRFARLRAVSTVAGNDTLARVTENACVAAAALGIAVPIHPGACRSIRNDFVAYTKMPSFAEVLAGRCPDPAQPASDSALVALSRMGENGWLIGTGPLTNIAAALVAQPALAARIGGVAFIGGSTGPGNVTAAAEFNVRSDPEAAAVVIEAASRGLEVRMVGLNVTHQVLMDRAFIDALRSAGSSGASLVAELLAVYIDSYPDAFVDESVAPLHDPCAVLAVTHPELFEWRHLHVDVELVGTHTRGATVVDQRGASARTGKTLVAIDVDAEGVLARINEALCATEGTT